MIIILSFKIFPSFKITPLLERILKGSGKGSKRREIPIEENLVHLKNRKSEPIFRTQRNDRFTNRRIQQIVKELATKAKIESIDITPHTLRHTRATFLAEDGMVKDYLQIFLGHDQSGTTEIYTKTAPLNTDQAFRKVVNDKSMN